MKALDTAGGHLILLLVVVVVGTWIMHMNAELGKVVIAGALAAFYREMQTPPTGGA